MGRSYVRWEGSMDPFYSRNLQDFLVIIFVCFSCSRSLGSGPSRWSISCRYLILLLGACPRNYIFGNFAMAR